GLGAAHKVNRPQSLVRGLSVTSPPVQARRAMIKLTFCLTRLPHLSREQFQDYWLNTHGPLVASVAETLQIRRYVQLHSFAGELSAGIRASRNAPAEYDGVAELWFDSLEALAANGEREEARAA